MNQTSSVVIEDPAPASPSRYHPSITAVEPSYQFNRSSDAIYSRGQCQTSQSSQNPLVTMDMNRHEETNCAPANDTNGSKKCFRRSRPSSLHSRRQSYHGNAVTWFHSSSVPPPLWHRGRQNGVSDNPTQTTEDLAKQRNVWDGEDISNRFVPLPNYTPQFQRHAEDSQRSDNVCSLASDRLYLPGMMDSFPQESQMAMNHNFPQVMASNSALAGPVHNHRAGNSNNRSRYKFAHSQDPKRRLSEVPLVKHRRNAERSPEYGRHGSGTAQHSYPRDKSSSRHQNRLSFGPEFMAGNDYNYWDNQRGGSSLLFHPPPPVHNSHNEHREAKSPDTSDSEQLPQHIGEIIRSRGRPVHSSRHPRSLSSEPSAFTEKTRSKAGGLDAYHQNTVHDSHYVKPHGSNQHASYKNRHVYASRNIHSNQDAHLNRNPPCHGGTENINSLIALNSKSATETVTGQSFQNTNKSNLPNETELRQEIRSQVGVICKEGIEVKEHGDEITRSQKDDVDRLKVWRPDNSQNRSLAEWPPHSKDKQPHVSLSPTFTPSASAISVGQKMTSDTGNEPIWTVSADASMVTVCDEQVNSQVSAIVQSPEAQQDLERAQAIGLPLKQDAGKKLNPNAKEYRHVPTQIITDASGNTFAMTTSHNGVCYFRPVSGAKHPASDSQYVINHDMQHAVKGNGTDIRDQVMVPIEPEPIAEHTYQRMVDLRTNTQDHEAHQLLVQPQQSQLQQLNTQKSDEVNCFHTELPLLQQQHLTRQEQNVGQQYSPLVSDSDQMFILPDFNNPIPLQVPVVQPSCDFPQGIGPFSYPHPTGLNLTEPSHQLFPTTQNNHAMMPTVPNVPGIQTALVPHPGQPGLEPGIIYNAPTPGIGCIPVFQFPVDSNGMPHPLATASPGNFPFLADQRASSTQMTPSIMPQVLAPQGQILYPPISGAFNPLPMYNHLYAVDTNHISQVGSSSDNVHQVAHDSPAVKSIGLNDAPDDSPSYLQENSVKYQPEQRSLYDKVKDTLQEIRENLRPRALLVQDREDKLPDSEDKQLDTELSKVVKKLLIIKKLGNKALLLRVSANLPDHVRPKAELMIRLLCIVDKENDSLNPAHIHKIACLYKKLTSSVPASVTHTLLKLLPEVGDKSEVSDSDLEDFVLKSLEEANLDEAKFLAVTDDDFLSEQLTPKDDANSKSQLDSLCTPQVYEDLTMSPVTKVDSCQAKNSSCSIQTPLKCSESIPLTMASPAIHIAAQNSFSDVPSIVYASTAAPIPVTNEKFISTDDASVTLKDQENRSQTITEGISKAIDISQIDLVTSTEQASGSATKATPTGNIQEPELSAIHSIRSEEPLVAAAEGAEQTMTTSTRQESLRQAKTAHIRDADGLASATRLTDTTPYLQSRHGSDTGHDNPQFKHGANTMRDSNPQIGHGTEARRDNNLQCRHSTDSSRSAGLQSRQGTPHPTPRHQSVTRVSRGVSHHGIRSPAFDKVDIASRIGVFESMKS